MLSKILGLYSQLKQSTEAIDLAVKKYHNGGTLREILTAATTATDVEADDAAVEALLNLLLRVENTLSNTGDLLGGIVFQAHDLERVLREVQTKPLSHIVESYDED